MILLDEDESSLFEASSKLAPSAHSTLRLPEPAAGRPSSTLPDYETSQAQQHSAAAHLHKPSPPSTFPKTRLHSRFWRGTFFALAIYVFLSVVIGIPLIVTRIAYRKTRPPPNISSLFVDDDDQIAAPLNLPSGAGGMVMAASSTVCDAWDWWNDDGPGPFYTSSAQHTLPPNGLFSVRSNATDEVVRQAGGRHNLTVDVNDDASETQVVMTMTLTANSVQLRKAAHFCFSSTGPGRGYSVYFPQDLFPTDYLAFDIRILFPQSPFTASDLITYLPMFHQSFGSLPGRVQSVNLAGAGVDIVCDSLQADKIAVKNSYASMSGTFNVTQSLTLDNIEGSIQTNITLNNDPSTGVATYMILDTGNNDIVADVTLVSMSAQTPHFIGNVQTFNGSLTMNVVHDAKTPASVLNLEADNNQGQSQVSLDSKFSGMFDLRSKLAPARVSHSGKPPSQWHIYTDSNTTSSTRGWAGWGTRPSYYDPSTGGKVQMMSSLSPVYLHLRT